MVAETLSSESTSAMPPEARRAQMGRLSTEITCCWHAAVDVHVELHDELVASVVARVGVVVIGEEAQQARRGTARPVAQREAERRVALATRHRRMNKRAATLSTAPSSFPTGGPPPAPLASRIVISKVESSVHTPE